MRLRRMPAGAAPTAEEHVSSEKSVTPYDIPIIADGKLVQSGTCAIEFLSGTRTINKKIPPENTSRYIIV